jgi:hypothetical protein
LPLNDSITLKLCKDYDEIEGIVVEVVEDRSFVLLKVNVKEFVNLLFFLLNSLTSRCKKEPVILERFVPQNITQEFLG